MNPDRRVAVLLYHNVGPRVPGTNRWLTISPRRFARHLRTLRRAGFTGITARQWLEYLQGAKDLPPKPVLLTFDDGYAAMAEHAFPVLRERGFPATVFLVTGLLGKSDDWEGAEGSTRMPFLRADQVRRWADEGIEFAAHSRTHADLRRLRAAALHQELAGSRADLEQLTGREVCAFAYPFGFYDDEVRAAAAAVFPLCFGTAPGLNDISTDPAVLRRNRVWPLESGLDVRARATRGWSPFIGGALSLAADLRRRFFLRAPS